jgi:cytochrome d ubiquinol oxidase subunit II
MDLNLFWFITLGILLIGYAILDGFDLGVGMVHPFAAKTDLERRLVMNSIGPLWDGNEVWLVTFGGALFAAFPEAYATAFSAFYLPFMLLLVSLIFRAVSLEFRSKVESKPWKSFWDWGFFGGSSLAAFLMGVAIGNSILGLAINSKKNYVGTFLDMLHPYAILVGLTTLTLFAMHGLIYLYLKTEGKLQQRILPMMWKGFGLFMVFFFLTTVATLVLKPEVTKNLQNEPAGWVVVLVAILAIANIPRAIFKQMPLYAFLSSSLTIAGLIFLFGAAMFPNMIISTIDPAYSLDLYNAASSQKTLGIMRNIAFLGMPFVLTYSAIIYWVFRGKVKLDSNSY